MVQLSAAIKAPLEVWEKAYEAWNGVRTPAGAERAKFDSWPDFTWFTNLDHLLSRGTTISVSFWGSREIFVGGYEGTVSISQLAEDTLRFVFSPQPSHFLSLQERYSALQVIETLRTAYRDSDEVLRNRNLITRIFLAIREWLYDKLGRWDPGFKQISTPARTSLRETLERPEVEGRLLVLSKRVWEKSFPNTPLPPPVPEFDARPAGPEPDKTLNHGNDHHRWRLRCVHLEATPAYLATHGQITAAIRGELPMRTRVSVSAGIPDSTPSENVSGSSRMSSEIHAFRSVSSAVPAAQTLGEYPIQDVSPLDHTILFNGRGWKCAGLVDISQWKVNDKIILQQDHMRDKGWYLVKNQRLSEEIYFSPVGVSAPTVGGSAKSTGAKTRWKDAIREVSDNWVHLHQHRPIQLHTGVPAHWKQGDLVSLMQDGKSQYLKNATQNDRVKIK